MECGDDAGKGKSAVRGLRAAVTAVWLVGFLAGIVIRQWGELPGLLVAIACMMVVPVLLAAFGTMAWSGKEMFLKKGDKK